MQTPPTFMIDHMVIKLGKYLRVLGVDAAWDLRLRTHDLIQRANREGRIFLTRNRHIEHQYPHPGQSILIQSTEPVQQLAQVLAAFDIDPQSALFTTCIRCNVPLNVVPDKTQIRAQVHPNVYDRHEVFYACPSCGTIFWRGSHVTNACRKLGLVPPAEDQTGRANG